MQYPRFYHFWAPSLSFLPIHLHRKVIQIKCRSIHNLMPLISILILVIRDSLVIKVFHLHKDIPRHLNKIHKDINNNHSNMAKVASSNLRDISKCINKMHHPSKKQSRIGLLKMISQLEDIHRTLTNSKQKTPRKKARMICS